MGFMNVYEPMYIYIYYTILYILHINYYIYIDNFLQVGQTKIGYYTTLPHSSESLLDFHHAWDRDICPENMSWKYCESERNGTAMWIFVVLCHIMYCHTTLYNIIQHYNLSQRLLWLQTSTRRGHDAGLSWTRKTRNRRNPKPKPGKTSPALRLKDIRRDIPWRCPELSQARLRCFGRGFEDFDSGNILRACTAREWHENEPLHGVYCIVFSYRMRMPLRCIHWRRIQ